MKIMLGILVILVLVFAFSRYAKKDNTKDPKTTSEAPCDCKGRGPECKCDAKANNNPPGKPNAPGQPTVDGSIKTDFWKNAVPVGSHAGFAKV